MDSDSLPAIIIIGALVNLVILYFLIKAAVRSANSEVERFLSILINLKTEEMKKEGFTNEEIANIINRVK